MVIRAPIWGRDHLFLRVRDFLDRSPTLVVYEWEMPSQALQHAGLCWRQLAWWRGSREVLDHLRIGLVYGIAGVLRAGALPVQSRKRVRIALVANAFHLKTHPDNC